MNGNEKGIISQALNENRAAMYIGVSPSTLANWRKDGIGPKYKAVIAPNSKKTVRILYPIKFLEEWLNDAVVNA